ncbi:YegP family protein [uncultured Tenacibaculum sp.]|uniref:YegP family protein n=1 Tax=uncultured Tenacibaculum sp. TaxID=174713 RepID=UPI00261599F8|nr:YegP family protein [uncultured Tenacibaculum sp.]
MGTKFQLYKSSSRGYYYFRLKSFYNKTLLNSEGYQSKAGCLNGIESVKLNSRDIQKFLKKKSSNGKYYFSLKASNGQIIGTSELYFSESACENSINLISNHAHNAEIHDLT